jgi:hypothetical protein
MSFQTSGLLQQLAHNTLHRGQSSDARNGELESVDRVTVSAVEGPGYALIEGLDGRVGLLRNVAHNGVHHLALIVPLLAFDDILG